MSASSRSMPGWGARSALALGHWTMIAVGRSAHGLVAGNVLSRTPWLWLATWVLQVMPVFFVVGGFSNMVSWQALERRGGGYVEYLSSRMSRLLRPVLVFATICIVALAIWQLALVMLARGRVSAWLARPRPWTAVIAVGSMAMTVYLWHLTAMVTVLGLVLAAHGPLPTPGGALWWATRPIWLALLAAALTPMAPVPVPLRTPRRRRAPAAERPAGEAPPVPSGGEWAAAGAAGARAPGVGESPLGRLAVILGLGFATLGLLGFVVTGFAPLLGSSELLPFLHVDPLGHLLHLLVGMQLASASGSGATARPGPWVLTAAGSAVLLALPCADPLTLTLHATVAVLALAIAATRCGPSGVGMLYNSLRRPSSS